MRLVFSNFVLASALISSIAFCQQPKVTSAPQVTEQGGAKDSGSRAAQPKKHVAHKSHSKSASKHGVKRAAYRPAYTQNAVEVMNGSSTQRVVFHDDEKAGGLSKDANAPIKVEVMNGTSTDTRYFNPGQGAMRAGESNRPVVVAIQSSDTRTAGGNKHPVVTGIISSGTGTAKSAVVEGDPVSKTVSPRPKRPAYQPESQ